MRAMWILAGAFALSALSGCGNDAVKGVGVATGRDGAAPESSADMAKASRNAPGVMTAQASTGAPVRQFPVGFGSDSIIPAMVIRTGQASIEVDSLEPAIALVRQLAQRLGGYVANSSLQAGNDQVRSATLEVKIPASRFDQALAGLQPIGKVEYVNSTAEDVGEEYVDIGARVANARRLEQRLIELLATRTGKLADVLSVEQQLARVREEIERMEGRMRYLRTRSAVSTLAVTVHEEMPVLAGDGSWGVLAESLKQAWRNFIGFLAASIQAMGVLVPLGVIIGVLVAVARRYLPRRPPPPATT
jgi:hypothetical protein